MTYRVQSFWENWWLLFLHSIASIVKAECACASLIFTSLTVCVDPKNLNGFLLLALLISWRTLFTILQHPYFYLHFYNHQILQATPYRYCPHLYRIWRYYLLPVVSYRGKQSKIPLPRASGGISRECFNPVSRNFTCIENKWSHNPARNGINSSFPTAAKNAVNYHRKVRKRVRIAEKFV